MAELARGDRNLKSVDIYTDGACSGNPGMGGWAAILIYKGVEKIISGFDKSTTNNRMELFSVIQALRHLKERCSVTLYTDSAYVADAFNKNWLDAWQKNNWKTASKGEVKNQDLWSALIFEKNKHILNFVKVRGHSDNELNNRCDRLAVGEIDKYKKQSGQI